MNALSSSASGFSPSQGKTVYSKERVVFENCIERIQQVAKQISSQIFAIENRKFDCPVNLGMMKDPTSLNCGHIFDRSTTEGSLTARVTTCPSCRTPITSRRGVSLIKNLIEEGLAEERIPTLSHFKGENKRFSERYLQIAKEHEEGNEFKEAFTACTQAFLYTNKSEDYAVLPQLYAKLEQKEKTSLAYLYLASYQLQEDKVEQAIESLKFAQEMSPEPLKMDALLVELLLRENSSQEQINEALSIASNQKDPEDAIAIYKQIIKSSPFQFEVYTALIPLLKNAERINLFSEAARYAKELGKVELAKMYLKAAYPLSISREDWINPSEFLNKIPSMPQSLQDFLEAPCPLYGPEKKASETHIVVPRSKNVIFNGTFIPFTLRILDQIDKSAGGFNCGFRHICEEILALDYPPEVEFEWLVMTKDVFSGSKGKNYEVQKNLVESKGYQVPGFRDAATCILWEYRNSGMCYYSKDSWTFTRCYEESQGNHVVVGAFGLGGLFIDFDSTEGEPAGIAGLLKF